MDELDGQRAFPDGGRYPLDGPTSRAEGVTKAVRGADPPWRAAAVAERFADLSDQIRNIGLDKECVRPEALLQHGLGEDSWTIHGERGQQLERLGREVNLAMSAHELVRVEIQREWAETNSQAGLPWRKPAKILRIS